MCCHSAQKVRSERNEVSNFAACSIVWGRWRTVFFDRFTLFTGPLAVATGTLAVATGPVAVATGMLAVFAQSIPLSAIHVKIKTYFCSSKKKVHSRYMTTLYHLTLPQRLRGSVALPASKSVSARALVMAALAGNCRLHGLSDCDDTRVLHRALTQPTPEIDIMAAGTAMRFATAYFAACPGGTHILTGTERMRQRPIRLLVDALRSLGADIEYTAAEGYPPLRITGRELTGGEVSIPANVSSQYISALLMIAPTMPQGLTLRLTGEPASVPYIDMTLSLMQTFGAEARWLDRQTLRVEPGGYRGGTEMTIEPDWSAASYWYEMVALSPDADAGILLCGLKPQSVQGDSCIWQIFEKLGVKTTFNAEGALLQKQPHTSEQSPQEILKADFTDCPDLAQTVVATCAMLHRPFAFSGLQSLKIKETDRIAALQTELQKLGISLETDDSHINLSANAYGTPEATPTIATYDDHRMAMAFAPCAYLYPTLRIAHPHVVSKSYPDFWRDLESVGARIEIRV